MKLKAINLSFLLFFILLIGCENNPISSNQHDLKFLGLWKFVGYETGGEQIGNLEHYIHITEDKITHYDYMGFYDQGQDCFNVEEYHSTLNNGKITIEDERVGPITKILEIKDDQLLLIQREGIEPFIDVYNKSNKEVSAFQPECTSTFSPPTPN